MAKIELYFGSPTTDKEWEMVEGEALAGDICIETAVIKDFCSIVKPLLIKTKNDENFFELVICSISGILVTLPAVTMGVYKHNGFVLPKMTINGDYALERESHQKIVIPKEWIDGLGQELEYKWNFEYFDFKIIGKVEAQKNEVLYLVRNRPHVYRSGNFIEAKI
jgi:hypothetical protein